MEGLKSEDMPSPSFQQYVYADAADQYFDNNSSDSQSPLASSYELSYMAGDVAADVYPSPEHDADSPPGESHVAAATPAPVKTPAKRKRENRYKNAPPSVLSRRRAQNRASQRAYRERKDQRIKDLEQMLGEAKQRNETLSQAYSDLHAEYVKLKTAQTQAIYPFDPTVAGLANNDRLDMDMFSYSGLSGYAG